MKNNTNKIKHIVLGVFLLSLLTPAIQMKFGVINEKVLSGFFDTEPFPVFSDSLFKEGIYQEKFEKAVTDNVGFHNFFVRFQNQFNYCFYNISKSSSAIIGKNGYLFDRSYVSGYNGDGFVGKEYIDLQIEKAKVIEQELNKKHIALIFAFAPGKGSFFSEYIPNQYLYKNSIDSSNYICYIKACSNAKLNMVDLRTYFLSIKDTVKHPLFSQVGVHWSDYGAFTAIERIAKKIEEIKKIKLPAFKINKFEYRDEIKDQDRDEEKMMNVFTDLPHYNMPYLKISYLKDSATVKPNVLTIADSYYSTIVATNIVDSIFSGWSYWLYSNRISSDKNKPFDLRSEIEKRDVILLLSTDATLAQFPYDFIDEAYELYAPKNINYYALKKKEVRLSVYQTIENIEKNKDWKNRLIKSAKEKGISQTEEFFNNALWIYYEKQRKLEQSK